MKPREQWMVGAVCVFLAAISWLVFGPTLGHGFANVDDSDYILNNRHVAGGLTLDSVKWAFTHVHSANWHPVTWISHMVDCQLYGLNPRGHHLSNVLLHTATAIFLFLTLRQMTGASWRSAFVAAVFAVHPLRVESVAWVAERKDVLSGCFFVLTVAAYVRYARRPWSFGCYALVLLLFAIGLMCKPMLVTVPLVLLLLDFWPLARFWDASITTRRLLFEKLPLLAFSAGACAATVFAQTVSIRPVAIVPISVRITNAITSCVAYVRQMFWPSDLAAFYPFSSDTAFSAAVLLSLLVLIASSCAVFIRRSRRYLVTGWAWYLIMLVPVIGIIPVGEQARADRYTYLPLIGMFLALTWAAADLCARWRRAPVVLGVLATGVVAALMIAARAQVAVWESSESRWRQALSRTADNAVARRNLGHALQEKGQLQEAVVQYERALQFDSDQARVHSNLGVTLLQLGQAAPAVAQFEKARELEPHSPEPDSNLGLVLLELGRADESVAYFQKAIETDSDFAAARYNLGTAFLQMGRAAEAVAQYRRAIELNPRDEQALNNLAWILATCPRSDVRDGAAAIRYAAQADSLTANSSPVIGATLAAAYAEAGRFGDAVHMAERAAALAVAQGNTALAEMIRRQLEFYRAGSPFRDGSDVSASR